MFELDLTQPSRRMDQAQYVRALRRPKRRNAARAWMAVVVFILAYFLAPLRTNLLLLGTDDLPERGDLGRTDTIILFTVVPFKPYVGMLSIPRDLWVQVPGVGEQRINTAYFFAEAQKTGTGPAAAMNTIYSNFKVPVHYYAVVHMLGLVSTLDALGGVDISLDAPLGGLPAGTHHLTGQQALDFVRERNTSDDFGRMQRTQVLIAATIKQASRPASWSRLPQFLFSLSRTVETNLPFWQWPRMGFALLRSLIFGIDTRSITREMVNPFVTSQGAQVLGPNWDAIRPVVKDMFGK